MPPKRHRPVVSGSEHSGRSARQPHRPPRRVGAARSGRRDTDITERIPRGCMESELGYLHGLHVGKEDRPVSGADGWFINGQQGNMDVSMIRAECCSRF